MQNIGYVPDYVANAGGIINVAAEFLGEAPCYVEDRVNLIGLRVAAILEMALSTGRPPHDVADKMAQDIIAGASTVVS